MGKTTLARTLGTILPEAQVVKIGHHPPKPEKPSLYFQIGVNFDDVARAAGPCRFLIIESGALLDDPALDPDLVIFLPGEAAEDKPGSARRRGRAQLIRGVAASPRQVESLRARLGVDADIMAAVIEAVQTPPG